MTRPSMQRAAAAELVGTGFLLAAVVGSGIMGERLAAGNVAIALLANTLATGAALVALIFTFAQVSGAHFNPVVTVSAVAQGDVPWSRALAYIPAQLAGALLGVVVAHVMFSEPLLAASTHDRSGMAQIVSEFVATFGLVAVIAGCSRTAPTFTPFAVGAYITGAYWFTSSTSFANPAVTLARAYTDTFAGIRPVDAPGFLLGQVLGTTAATLFLVWLLPRPGTAKPPLTVEQSA